MTYLGASLLFCGVLIFGVAMLALALGLTDPVTGGLVMIWGVLVGYLGAEIVGDA